MAYKNQEDKKAYFKKYREKNKEKIQLVNKRRSKIRREDRKKQGACTNCGKNPPLENQTQCQDCKNRQKNLLKKRIQKGLCRRCGLPQSKGTTYCSNCLDKQYVKTQKKKEMGICYDCGNIAVASKSRCTKCFMKAMAKEAGTTVDILKEIWDKQNGICAYSGRKLIIGENASVDHKIPRTKGGSNAASNLQFIHKNVNIAKHNLLEKDFIQLIKDCHSYFMDSEVEVLCNQEPSELKP